MRKLSFAFLAFLALAPTPAHASATIVINNANGAGVGFNDPTPVDPVGNNPGTTLGAQRLFAFQAAANIWGQLIDSNVPIVINAQFTALTCTATGAVLGSAGATEVYRDFPGALLANTWYPPALASSLFGSDVNPAVADMNANFNINLGNPGCLTGIPFYLGADNNAPASSVDLVVVLLHEFGHGLGFATFLNGSTGAELDNRDDVYEHHLIDTATGVRWTAMTNVERQASTLNARHVVWDGAQVVADVPSYLAPGVPTLTVNAPAGIAGQYLIGPASFGAPIGSPLTAPVVYPVDSGASTLGCNAFAVDLTGQIALIDRGVCGFTAKVKNAQDAGAVAVLIVDNAAGTPPADLGGVDPTVTIPSGRITLPDGNTFKANLSGLSATLQIDSTVRAGADSLDRAMTFNPNPFQGGSSNSHWDTSANPNVLMEPAINVGLNYDVDLTLSAFRDIGWSVEADADGVPASDDNCPDAFNPGQEDTDHDGVGNACEPVEPLTVSINAVTVTEGNTGTTNAAFTVSLSAASPDTVTVQYATAPDSAVSPADFTPLALTTLTFNPGETAKPVTVKVKGDMKNEEDETFFVNLSNPTNASLGDAQGVGTIDDNDPLPVLSVNSVSSPEGAGNKNVNLTVKLTPASGRTVTVDYTTADGTATLADNDYTTKSGTLTFNPGQTSKTVAIQIKGDHTAEADETLTLELSDAANATAPVAHGTLTIQNDDEAVPSTTVSIDDVTLPEGNSGTTNWIFTVTLSGTSTQAVSVHYATADGSAVAPGDYAAKSGTLTFNPGQTIKTVSVPVKGNLNQEPTETFTVTLSAPLGLTVADGQGQGIGTITNDDAAPTLSISDKSVTEGNSGAKNVMFTVTLSSASLNSVHVDYQTADSGPAGPGVATAGVDYVATGATLTFDPGQMSKTFNVSIKGDVLVEGNETFVVNLSNPTDATIADAQATGTIVDNE